MRHAASRRSLTRAREHRRRDRDLRGEHQPRFLGELQSFVRIPSVSADPARGEDVKRCGEWLAAHLKKIGLDRVRVLPTKRHPIVYGEWMGVPAEADGADLRPLRRAAGWTAAGLGYPPFSGSD